MHRRGTNRAVEALKQGNARGAKGAGHSTQSPEPTGSSGGARRDRLKAAAFDEWHEPDDRRQSRPDL